MTTDTTYFHGTYITDMWFDNTVDGYMTGPFTIFKTDSRGRGWLTDHYSQDTLLKIVSNGSRRLFCIGSNGTILSKDIVPTDPSGTIIRVQAPALLSFGAVAVGSDSVLAFTLTNTGTASMDLDLQCNGDFSLSSDSATFSSNISVNLIPWQDVHCYIRFSPGSNGVISDSVLLNAPGLSSMSILLNGIGVPGFIDNLSSDTVLCSDTLWIGRDLYIPDGVTVTICPGTHILVLGNYRIRVQGRLIMQGTSADSIIVSVLQDQLPWKGIQIDNTHPELPSILERVSMVLPSDHAAVTLLRGAATIRQSRISTSITSGSSAGISIEPTLDPVRLMILNCEIFESPTGISGQYSDSCLLLYNHIHHNATGISLRQSTYLRIDSNEVSENTGMGIRTSGRLDLSGNEIHHNGGGLLLASSGNLSNDSARLVGNRIHHNSTAGGLQMETGDQPVYLGGNLIYNNTNLQMHGGGLSLWQSTGPSSCIIENNTIANNDVLRFLSGYNFFLNSQTNGLLNIRLTNNIFWSSRFQPLNMVLPPSSALDFRNNCINQDSSLVWSNSNLNAYPEFVNPTLTAGASDTTANPDWALNWNSPCINAGNSFTSDNLPPFDLLGNARIFDGQVDIGALEYPRWTGLLDPDLGDPVLLYPNPARSYIRVRSPAPGIIEFNINDIVGKVQLFGKIRDTEIIDISKLLPGAYNLSLRTSEGTLFQTRFIRY